MVGKVIDIKGGRVDRSDSSSAWTLAFVLFTLLAMEGFVGGESGWMNDVGGSTPFDWDNFAVDRPCMPTHGRADDDMVIGCEKLLSGAGRGSPCAVEPKSDGEVDGLDV